MCLCTVASEARFSPPAISPKLGLKPFSSRKSEMKSSTCFCRLVSAMGHLLALLWANKKGKSRGRQTNKGAWPLFVVVRGRGGRRGSGRHGREFIAARGSRLRRVLGENGGIDENVFDIKQGVSINIFVRRANEEKKTLGKVYH